jgi:hypothetical protein
MTLRPVCPRCPSIPLKISNLQRLVSPQNTAPNKSFLLERGGFWTLEPATLTKASIEPFYLEPSPFNWASISSLFHCACAFTSKIQSASRILPGLNIVPFPLGLRPILKSKIISHILQPLAFWQEISPASLPISLHTLADTRTLRFRFTVTSHPMWLGLSFTLEHGELICSGFDHFHLCACEFAAHYNVWG